MGKFLIVLALLLFVFEVQPKPLSRLRRLARLRHVRQAVEEATTTEEVLPETDPSVTTEPQPTTEGYPPSDPNDACHGCPVGEVCREVYPPCARPPPDCLYPRPEYTNPDYQPVTVCDDYYNNYNCHPIPICIDIKYEFWFK